MSTLQSGDQAMKRRLSIREPQTPSLVTVAKGVPVTSHLSRTQPTISTSAPVARNRIPTAAANRVSIATVIHAPIPAIGRPTRVARSQKASVFGPDRWISKGLRAGLRERANLEPEVANTP